MKKTVYLLDSDVFITARNSHYAFDLCPGFWRFLLHHHGEARIISIDRVRRELLSGRGDEDLVQWVKNDVPADFFQSADTEEVIRGYADIMNWVNAHPDYSARAQSNFADGADGWLVAYAQAHEATVVTHEVPAPRSKKNVKIPDVCDNFGVPWQSPFTMLRALGARFDWS